MGHLLVRVLREPVERRRPQPSLGRLTMRLTLGAARTLGVRTLALPKRSQARSRAAGSGRALTISADDATTRRSFRHVVRFVR
jgi:hypothetical protein